ncbi:Glycine--tRNA ligase beta subunit [Buchnera aphidicola (Protaphis terricola)]|uniref:glycine--tRNA ligase subunit beta n=1 Tax=Buchnera aphidicola TaxID=9 RepID=UPI0034641332
MKKIFLVEIGTEELPAKILYQLITLFHQNTIEELKSYDIQYKKIDFFATPRRLALKIFDIDTHQKIKKILKKGPSIQDAFDKNGIPTKAANSWAQHLGIQIKQADYLKNKKGQWLIYYIKQKQESIIKLLPKIIEISLKKINIKNLMRWEINNNKFFRPIRNILMILDNKIINNKIFNLKTQKKLHNHIAYKEKKICLDNAKDYPLILFKHNQIIANYNERKEKIKKEIQKIAKMINGYIKLNILLLEEVNSMVESPMSILASFKKKYIKYIPSKILIYIIEKQQKCFPIYNNKKEILPYFIFTTNVILKNTKRVILDNERVMESRLADIIFFLNKDNQIKLLDYLPLLKNVLFYKNLGTLYDKTMRLKSLVNIISYNNKKDLIRAVILSKCDLITDMVCEFPELQGIIGMYYAINNQEKYNIAISIKEQYLPSFSGDKLPSTMLGSILSIIDKIDTLSGMFLINEIPLSNRDPFALRRSAIGIIRIILHQKISLDLNILIMHSLKKYNKNTLNHILVYNKIIAFLKSRLMFFYEKKGYNIKIIQSVLNTTFTDILDINQRIKALSKFQKTKQSESIFTTIKRISNILKNNYKNINNNKININLIQTKEEKKFFEEIKIFNYNIKKLFKEKNYELILSEFKKIKYPVNEFFKKVRINDCNPEIKNNRLILLKKIEKIFFNIADFSYLY